VQVPVDVMVMLRTLERSKSCVQSPHLSIPYLKGTQL
jgi:hypothetical protein